MKKTVHSSWFIVHGKNQKCDELTNQLTNNQRGFTIVEVLVVSLILGIIGFMLSDIITRSIAGSQKTFVIGNSKQNGQVALDAMTQVMRNSDQVVCLDNSWTVAGGNGNMIVLYSQDGHYVRFQYVAGDASHNGYLSEDFPDPSTTGLLLNGNPYDLTTAANSSRRLCNTDSATGVALTGQTILTDRDPQGGVNIGPAAVGTPIFTVSKNPGTTDSITVQFGVIQGVSGSGFQNTLATPTQFRETVQLR